eukprot:TRINITY_DN21823_c0_g1_i1.p1 TRINITY_DN21823_c0_g1~~TRINITY_DN21823_c0_g1_i1.p1  ORF type:complete len:252 (-),score=40.44 TRINITY_DN21823_c0_g1_i1:15-770(-)
MVICIASPCDLTSFLSFRAFFRGLVSNLTNREFAAELFKPVLDYVGASESSTPIETHVHCFELKDPMPVEAFLSHSEADELSSLFNVRSLTSSDVAVLKISFLPHQDGPHATTTRFQWNKIFENVLDCDLANFLNRAEEGWARLNECRDPASAKMPFIWRMFTSHSYKKAISFLYDAYLGHKEEQVDQLEFLSITGRKTECCVKWKVSMYPLIHTPESIILAARPVTSTFGLSCASHDDIPCHKCRRTNIK